MKIILRYFLMTIMAVCLYLPCFSSQAEAANIVVLPVINNVDYPDIESTFYDNVIDTIKHQQKYELIDNDAITAIIDKTVQKGQLPDENAMRDIAQKTGADLVVSVELNKLSLEPINSRSEDTSVLILDGKTAYFDTSEDKYKIHRFLTDEELEMGYYTRQNVPLRFWARHIQREMHRVMKVKGLNIQKPRISKF